MSLDPDDSTLDMIYANQAVALSSIGRHAEALASMEHSFELESETQDFHRLSNLAILLVLNGRTSEGVKKLEEAVKRLNGVDDDNAETAIVRNLLIRTRNQQEWREHIRLWVKTFAKHGALAYLGQGIVRSVRAITAIDWLTMDDAESWNSVWQDLGAGHRDLALPLRLLDAAVGYLREPSERVLLSLTAEERPILVDLLGLDRVAEPSSIARVA